MSTIPITPASRYDPEASLVATVPTPGPRTISSRTPPRPPPPPPTSRTTPDTPKRRIGRPTCIVSAPVTPWYVARTSTAPLPTAVRRPDDDTVASVGADEIHIAEDDTSSDEPSTKRAVALS